MAYRKWKPSKSQAQDFARDMKEIEHFFIKEDEEVFVKIGDDNLPKIAGSVQGKEYDPTVKDIVRLLNYTKKEAEEYLGINQED